MQETPDIDAAVARILAGDKDAYRAIIERCEARVRVILAAILPREVAVEDVAQEVFVTVFLKLAEYRIGTNFDAWIGTIARNHARNELRKWIRRHQSTERYRAHVEDFFGERLDAITERGDDGILASVRTCMSRLAGVAGKVVHAFYVQNLSGRDIAKSYGKTEGWVRLVLYRARQMIARCLKEEGVMSDAAT